MAHHNAVIFCTIITYDRINDSSPSVLDTETVVFPATGGGFTDTRVEGAISALRSQTTNSGRTSGTLPRLHDTHFRHSDLRHPLSQAALDRCDRMRQRRRIKIALASACPVARERAAIRLAIAALAGASPA
jgi:hypothetical protein